MRHQVMNNALVTGSLPATSSRAQAADVQALGRLPHLHPDSSGGRYLPACRQACGALAVALDQAGAREAAEALAKLAVTDVA